ncbi:hypothetical protein D9M71_46540 [compost metagenome]
MSEYKDLLSGNSLFSDPDVELDQDCAAFKMVKDFDSFIEYSGNTLAESDLTTFDKFDEYMTRYVEQLPGQLQSGEAKVDLSKFKAKVRDDFAAYVINFAQGAQVDSAKALPVLVRWTDEETDAKAEVRFFKHGVLVVE